MSTKITLLACLLLPLLHAAAQQKPLNIIFILADDHRYDAMGFMNRIKGLETPGMDRMAREGAHLQNAFVSTALCSPSRASILTGQYAHTHTVVDPVYSRIMAAAIKDQGGDVKLTLYPETGHNSWDKAFGEKELMPWLFSKHK